MGFLLKVDSSITYLQPRVEVPLPHHFNPEKGGKGVLADRSGCRRLGLPWLERCVTGPCQMKGRGKCELRKKAEGEKRHEHCPIWVD
jgi:hypothetical protein